VSNKLAALYLVRDKVLTCIVYEILRCSTKDLMALEWYRLTNGTCPASSRVAWAQAHWLPCRICCKTTIRPVVRLLMRLL